MNTLHSVTQRPTLWRAIRPSAALVGLALAGLLSTAALAQSAPPPMAPGAGMHAMPGGPGMGVGKHGMGMMGHDRMLDQIGASADQKAKVHEIFKAAHDDVRAQRQAARPLHDEMARLMAAPTVDAVAVEAQRQKMSAQHDLTSKRMTRAMLDASAVLTPEQRQKLAEQTKQRRDMMERHHRERQGMDGAKR